MPVNRKRISLTEAEQARAKEFAAFEGAKLSGLFREWILNFLKNGSDYVAPTMVETQIVIDPAIADAAEKKAREEYGCSLRDIIRFEIAELDKL
ncbi:hypothetical protein SEA_PEPE25_74 [Microbacterium phage Pepe25]|nr:hypothetical protein SEA_PEPE25_74 [Microbacterium phage Pepe25]